MEDSFVFVFPDGRSAEVGRGPTGLIGQRLWNLGLAAGAAIAAVRISEALLNHAVFATEVRFEEREVAVTLEAAKAHPPTWMRLADEETVARLSRDERRRLVATCVDLIKGLDCDNQHPKVAALIRDLERVRDQLKKSNSQSPR